MADTASVHELGGNQTTPRVYRVRDERPARDLLVGVQTGGVRVALTYRAGLGALADDEPGRGPLAVVLRSELSWCFTCPGSVAGQRRHHEAVGELKAPKLIGREKVFHGWLLWLDC